MSIIEKQAMGFEDFKSALESSPTPSWVALSEAYAKRESEKGSVSSETRFEIVDYKENIESSQHMLEAMDKIKAHALRDNWSGYVKFWFFVMIGIQALLLPVLFIFLFIPSLGIKFSDIKPFVYLVSGENFVNILALVIIIVKYLFPTQIQSKQ